MPLPKLQIRCRRQYFLPSYNPTLPSHGHTVVYRYSVYLDAANRRLIYLVGSICPYFDPQHRYAAKSGEFSLCRCPVFLILALY